MILLVVIVVVAVVAVVEIILQYNFSKTCFHTRKIIKKKVCVCISGYIYTQTHICLYTHTYIVIDMGMGKYYSTIANYY